MRRLHKQIAVTEFKALIALANRLHFTHDPISRKQQLLEGLCHITGGVGGSCIVRHNHPVNNKPTLVSETQYRNDATPLPAAVQQLMDDDGADARSATARTTLARGLTLDSTIRFPEAAVAASIVLFHSVDTGHRFTQRQRSLVDVFHNEMNWLYQADVLLASPNALALSPRARQTLEHLLAGLSEKQIASKLKLSKNTVHHYVKVIHKHFGVSSRSELLARWVGK